MRRILTPILLYASLAVLFIGPLPRFDKLFSCTSLYRFETDGHEYFFSAGSLTRHSMTGLWFEADSTGETVDVSVFSCCTRRNRVYLDTGDGMRRIKFRIRSKGHVIKGRCKLGNGIGGRFTVEACPKEKFIEYDGRRYKEQCFEVKCINDIKYARVRGYWDEMADTGESYGKVVAKGFMKSIRQRNLDLKMDIYTPDGDSAVRRPLIMFIHGGAFYVGKKDSESMVHMSNYFAERGFVVASIDYRLGFLPSKSSVERTGYQAIQDAHAAMRFLVANADDYGIDTSMLFVAGASAGSITALSLCFMTDETRPESTRGRSDMGAISSSGNKLTDTFHIRAVANMWGAVNDINCIRNIGTDILSIHGDADKIVPYDYNYPFRDFSSGINEYFFDKMYGSKMIDEQAQKLGIRSRLHTYHGLGHSLFTADDGTLSPRIGMLENQIKDFLYPIIVPEPVCILKMRPQWYELSSARLRECSWHAEGGFIVSRTGSAVRVLWINGVSHRLQVSGLYDNGMGFNLTADIDSNNTENE